MYSETFYCCLDCGVVIAKPTFVKYGEPGFPESADSWQDFLLCPVCRAPKMYKGYDVLYESR